MLVNQHKGIFAHPHAQIHGDVLEKGRNVADRAREEKDSSSSLSFSLLFFFFWSMHRRKTAIKHRQNKRVVQERTETSRNRHVIIRVVSRVHSNHKEVDASRERTATSCSLDPSIALSGCVSGARVTKIKIQPSSHASSYLLLLSQTPPSSCFALIVSPVPWIEFS